ncbi:MAG: ABC transporter substrate-binding protein [Acidithiobacillus sp.]
MRIVRGVLVLVAVTLMVAMAGPVYATKGIAIRIAYPSGMNGEIPVVMNRYGIAVKNGLNARFVFFQYGPPAMEALASGKVDAVVTSLMPVTTFIFRRPHDAVIVANLGQSSFSLMVSKASLVKNVSGLSGKKIAVSFGSDSYLSLVRYLKAAHLVPGRNVTLLNMQPNELMFALTQGYADAIVVRQPQVLEMQEKFGARIIHTWPFRFVSLVRTAYLEQHPGALARYMMALRQSILFIAQHKRQASIAFGKTLRLDPKIIEQVSVDNPQYRAHSLSDIDISVTPKFVNVLKRWFAASYQYKMISKPISGQPWILGQ